MNTNNACVAEDDDFPTPLEDAISRADEANSKMERMLDDLKALKLAIDQMINFYSK